MAVTTCLWGFHVMRPEVRPRDDERNENDTHQPLVLHHRDVRRHPRTPAELVRWRSVARGPEARSNLRLDFFPVLVEHVLYLPRLVLHHLRHEPDLLLICRRALVI